MPLPTLTGLRPKPTTEDIIRKINELVNELNMLLLNLDTLNVVSLNAEVIEANTITGDKIAANTITADKLDVDELSAITANLGTVTAGSITSNTTINVGTDATIGNNIFLGDQNSGTLKSIRFSNSPGAGARINYLSGDLSFIAEGFVSLNIGSSQGLVVNKKVAAPSFDATSGMTINGIAVIKSGDSTSAHTQPDHNHGITPGRYIMTYDSDGNQLGLQQWAASGGFTHSHTVVG